ncbi:hypothetical protein ACU4GD_22710 [Cupriavidus basilensis]
MAAPGGYRWPVTLPTAAWQPAPASRVISRNRWQCWPRRRSQRRSRAPA